MIGNKLEELTPDWQQIYLNGGPPCFAVMEEDLRFCNRAERWEGHPSDHKFVSWTDFLFEVMMWGQNAHASHTAALREKAEALVVVLDAGIVKANQFSLGVRRTDELLERLTALKAELDKEQR